MVADRLQRVVEKCLYLFVSFPCAGTQKHSNLFLYIDMSTNSVITFVTEHVREMSEHTWIHSELLKTRLWICKFCSMNKRPRKEGK